MQIANSISDGDRDGGMNGQTGLILYALSTILWMAEALKFLSRAVKRLRANRDC